MTERSWSHDLISGCAAALDLFDPPELIDEALLAKIARQIASDSDELGYALFLRALADAFDNPHAARRLTLSKGRRGRPANSSVKFQRAMFVGPKLQRLIEEGWKKEAAVQSLISELKLSRSSVLRLFDEYKRFRPLTDAIQLSVDEVTRRKFKK